MGLTRFMGRQRGLYPVHTLKPPHNTFRNALSACQPQIGGWVGSASPDLAEALNS